jgi:Mrp family chromosome partitioning ATPase
MNEILVAHFQTLRVRIEGEVKTHSIIMVTSANTDDGARLTAFGLAETLAAAGHQTALVDATANPAEAIDGRFKMNGRRDFPIYALPRGDGKTSRIRETLETFGRQVRAEFDYTIVDAPPFGRQSVTRSLAAAVDAVLIALRLGRQPCKADDLLVHALGVAGAHVIGVVGAAPESIGHFETNGGAVYVTEPRPLVAAAPLITAGEVPQIRIRSAR